MDIEVLVRSRVDILLKEQWADPIGTSPEMILWPVAILRDRLDVAVAGETVIFKIHTGMALDGSTSPLSTM